MKDRKTPSLIRVEIAHARLQYYGRAAVEAAWQQMVRNGFAAELEASDARPTQFNRPHNLAVRQKIATASQQRSTSHHLQVRAWPLELGEQLDRYRQGDFDESRHPRAPAGRSDGGQFVDAHGGTGSVGGTKETGSNAARPTVRHPWNESRPPERNSGYFVDRNGMLLDPETMQPIQLAGGLFPWATGTSKVQGHHWVPRKVWGDCRSLLTEEATKVLDELKTDPKAINHGFDTWQDLYQVIEGKKQLNGVPDGVTHHEYSQSVEDLLKQYHKNLYPS